MPRPNRPEHGALIISFDVSDVGDRRVQQAASEALGLVRKRHVACTWIVADPASSPLTAQALTSSPRQEMALLATADWAGASVLRHRFGAELRERIRAAAACGCTVESLVSREQELTTAYDLLVREGVAACAAPASSPELRLLRYGLWQIPFDQELDGRSRWRAARRVRRALDRLAGTQETLHVLVDGAELARRGTTLVGMLVERAVRLRERSGLVIETLGEAAGRLATVSRPEPSRSILRRAA